MREFEKDTIAVNRVNSVPPKKRGKKAQVCPRAVEKDIKGNQGRKVTTTSS